MDHPSTVGQADLSAAQRLAGKRVTVMGLGTHGGGVAVARYLVGQGASVTVTDLAGPDRLAESLEQLHDLPLAVHLGGHQEADFCTADLLVVNPAVRPDNRFVRMAQEAGVRITSEIELFLDRCPAIVVGVTGSNGKSTTATMLASIVQASGRTAWLGGNIGVSLLPMLPRIELSDVVVLELSSFQLHWLSPSARMPALAIVTNCTPNHLDWHPDFEHYERSKRRLLESSACRAIVLDADEAGLSSWLPSIRWKTMPLVTADSLPPLPVAGEHNRQNARLAATAALILGGDDDSLRAGLAAFTPLPYRLAFVAEIAGRRFYNDAKSTTAEATIAAMNGTEQPCWLIAGGLDKGVGFDRLAEAIVTRARGAAFFGAASSRMAEAVRRRSQEFSCVACETMHEAAAWCWENSVPGDAVLCSPACASYDQFRDFADRGRQFNTFVERLANAHSG